MKTIDLKKVNELSARSTKLRAGTVKLYAPNASSRWRKKVVFLYEEGTTNCNLGFVSLKSLESFLDNFEEEFGVQNEGNLHIEKGAKENANGN